MYILDSKKIKIEKSEKNRLSLTTQDGKTYKNVNFLLLFPFTDLENHVSAVIRKGAEYTEIGIIRHLKSLPKTMSQYVREDLKLRYFVPEIIEINSITTRYWFHKFDVKTDRGNKIFYLRNVRENVRFKADSSIVITDMEKCRYKIPDYDNLSAKTRAELDRILL